MGMDRKAAQSVHEIRYVAYGIQNFIGKKIYNLKIF
jgi:hypothetical protein